jgi:competence protein ComEA
MIGARVRSPSFGLPGVWTALDGAGRVAVEGPSFRDRLRGLDRRELIGLAVAAVAVVAGAGFWYVRSLPSQVRVESVSGDPADPGAEGSAAPAASASPSPTAPAGPVVVHVAGWVVRPGVYELPGGSRVVDALDMAGGAKAGADLRSINLAAVLVDGEQVLVAKADGGGTSGTSGGGGPAPGGAGGTGGAPGELVDINTATFDQLLSLPGVGEVLAQRILDYRTEHGRFGSVDELLNVSGIGEAKLADIKPKVTV